MSLENTLTVRCLESLLICLSTKGTIGSKDLQPEVLVLVNSLAKLAVA